MILRGNQTSIKNKANAHIKYNHPDKATMFNRFFASQFLVEKVDFYIFITLTYPTDLNFNGNAPIFFQLLTTIISKPKDHHYNSTITHYKTIYRYVH